MEMVELKKRGTEIKQIPVPLFYQTLAAYFFITIFFTEENSPAVML